MDAVEDFIRDRVDLFILAALIEKKGFYEKCGYRCIDNEIFVDEGAKQCWMTKRGKGPNRPRSPVVATTTLLYSTSVLLFVNEHMQTDGTGLLPVFGGLYTGHQQRHCGE
ncbi:hypothetical protein Pcac1_g26763 [Phytophthora cactorum]|uniref:Acyl-CoA N-acyltransferase n=1 Tax=Phytophthora cactorum TaxID=29920 RepID=A0A8T1B7Z5_9STRA|nr:hypothetical protein Pcac1_g26763 [Phytophthora cactorum]KAG2897103.1 hypothetical protein PC115_g17315 [Phytophthora cactorum]KAG2963952.1 hypothetical protein PC119_g25370 [Phytophthora cactorum]KAG3088675.1 hypothetical protein PC121_g4411 [Phytophthora cactorum]KAG3161783.1 hypothetical protein PC128_g20732 [Phytophthora cactorum]